MIKQRHLFYFIFALILLCYGRVLFLDFTLDDVFLIKQNRYLSTDWNRLLTSDLWAGDETAQESSFFRPLFLLSLIIDWSLGALNPFYFHLQSLMWHLLCTYLVYRLVDQISNTNAALVSMLIFGLHPVQSEVVCWVSARNDSMATAFALGGLLIFMRKQMRWYDWVFGSLLFFCALISKENTIFMPLIVYMFAETDRLKKLFGGGLAVALALLVRSLFSITVNVPDQAHWSLFMEKISLSIVNQFSLIIVPWPLSPVRPLAWETLAFTALISSLLFLFVAYSLLHSQWGKKGLVFAFLTYVPVLGAIVSNGVYGDRYLYLPMVGLALGIGVCWRFRYWMLSIVFFWGVVLWFRVPHWQSDESLWGAIYHWFPSPYSAASLAHIQYNHEKYRDAASLYQESYSDAVPYLAGCDTYVASVLKVKGPEVAIDAGLWSLDRGCSLSGKYAGILAVCLAGVQDWENAKYILHLAPPDPSKRDVIVHAALAVRDGRWDDYVNYRDNWNASTSLVSQVQILLRGDEEGIILDALPLR